MGDNMGQTALVVVQWNMLAATRQNGIIGTEEYGLNNRIKRAFERKFQWGEVLPSGGPDLCSQAGRKGVVYSRLVRNYTR